jgi:hypothetical protein
MGTLTKLIKWMRSHSLEVTSLFVAVLALFATIYQAELTREHNRMSVVPIILFSSDRVTHKISLVNEGVGLGIVLGLEVKVGKQSFVDNDIVKFDEIIADLIKHYGIDLNGSDFSISLGQGLFVVRPGESFELLKLKNKQKSKEFLILMSHLEFGVCYKSIYSDRFYVNTSGFLKPPANSCYYMDTVKVLGSHYRYHGVLDRPLDQSKLFR